MIKYLLEDAESDRMFRNEARKIYEDIVSCVMYNRMHPTPDGGFIIAFEEIDKKYRDLYVKIVSKDHFIKRGTPGIVAGFGKTPDGVFSIITLPVLIKENDLSYLNTRISGIKNSIIHELIHYLDTKRRKKEIKIGSALKYDANDETAYINNPEEYNAYFQEAMEVMDSIIDKNYEALKGYLVDFDIFKEIAIQYLSKRYYELLKPKWKNKFNQRLYKYYIDKMEKINEKNDLKE